MKKLKNKQGRRISREMKARNCIDVKNANGCENTVAKVWERELINLSDIVGVVKTANFTEKTNLKIILDSLDSMYLLEHCKNDLLMFAVKKTGLLPADDFNNIDKNALSRRNSYYWYGTHRRDKYCKFTIG